MKYKIVFSDIDGTLLDSNHKVSTGTIESVQRLKLKQIPFILVSARMPEGMIPLQQVLNINEPLICFSGALILGPTQRDGNREVLFNKEMEAEDVRGIYTLISHKYPDVCFSAYNKDNWYVISQEDEWIVQERAITGIHANPFDFANDVHPPFNKLLIMGPPGTIASLEVELKENYPITIYKSKPTYLEIMAQKVLKSSAIKSLICAHGILREETIAIGDNYNDMDMLRFAGLGVAMGNAPDEVKSAADVITLSNDEDGLRAALETYCN